jgi:hypothetical protein
MAGSLAVLGVSINRCVIQIHANPVEVIVLAKVNEGTAEGANTDRNGAGAVRVRPDMDAMEV